MGRGARYFIVGLVAVAAAAWLFRDHLRAPATALRATVAPVATPVQETPDVLYTWVDKDGVTHYEQRRGGKAERVEFDGRRLTPVAPVDPELAGRIREAAGTEDAADPGAVAEGEAALQGATGLHALRNELQEGARQMQANKAARHPDL